MPKYDEIEIEDMIYDSETMTYSYPCPCGDRFKISLEDLWEGEDIADCNSCTLYIQVIYEESDLPPLPDEDDTDDDGENKEITKDQGGNSAGKGTAQKKKDIDSNHDRESTTMDVMRVIEKLALSSPFNDDQKSNNSTLAVLQVRSHQFHTPTPSLFKEKAWPANRVVHSSHSLIRLSEREHLLF